MKLDWRKIAFFMKSEWKLFTPPGGLGGYWPDREIWWSPTIRSYTNIAATSLK